MGFPFAEVVFGSISVILSLYTQKYMEMDKAQSFSPMPNNFNLPNVQEYDFIVVGAGTSGSVVANKLSEKFNTLLLETGGNPVPSTYMPGSYPFLHTDPSVAYQWKSVKQNDTCMDTDGYCMLHFGRALGGTTTVNGMIYNRGHPLDYVNWAKKTGDDKWNYENLVPYFQMHENFIGENIDHLGFDGPLKITKKETVLNDQEMLWKDAWMKAGTELGFEIHENSNGPQKKGFVPVSQTIHNGVRVTSYDSFIKPIEDRKTLTVLKYSKATKIDIDDNGRAAGVVFERHGIKQYAKAKNEIIVSAGTMNSPWLLMQSGIGPADQLKEAGIKVKANLPVGQYWQDHPISIYSGISLDKTNYENLGQADIDDYINSQKGPLSNIIGVNAQAFITTEAAKAAGADPSWPDVQLILYYLSKELFPHGDDTMRVIVSLGVVQSYGTVSLNKTHPQENLVWDPNYLSSERDFNAMLEGLEMSSKIFKTEPFKALGAKLDPTPIPGCENLEVDTRDYLKCFIRQRTATHWHNVGTCRMGAENDSTAVVDTKLKVKGISGLRVIDNSISPAVTNANTQGPAYVIGQKGAHLILEEY